MYSSQTILKNSTVFESQITITPSGTKNETSFSHPLHETMEITTGITDNFELGFYLSKRINNGTFNLKGSHIRPRIKAPTSLNWYFGTNLSEEDGFIKRFNNQYL